MANNECDPLDFRHAEYTCYDLDIRDEEMEGCFTAFRAFGIAPELDRIWDGSNYKGFYNRELARGAMGIIGCRLTHDDQNCSI
jgi:hypothetical protein